MSSHIVAAVSSIRVSSMGSRGGFSTARSSFTGPPRKPTPSRSIRTSCSPRTPLSTASRREGPLGTPLGLAHWKRASSPVEAGIAGYLCFQTPIAGSLQTGDRRVRPRLGLRQGTPLASRDVPRERGRLSSCTWNLGFFLNAALKNCLFVLTAFTGWSSARCPGIGFLSRGDREIGVLRNVEPPTRPRLECIRETGLILRCDRKVGNPFQTKQGSRPSCPDQEGRKGSEEGVPENLSVPLEGDRDFGELCGSHQGCQVPFRPPIPNVGLH